ncbi:hypothetical protein BV898_06286 [Hypsibius exemplaris]|uniref:Uncharacterized protein n=1 Tax=Hypsibius exemplaris TaxID=2072580 RepID=A0A1W0WX23_HYPEX|nr:hypothetical protein BV898_06286 [Hypsibius exemplaris]
MVSRITSILLVVTVLLAVLDNTRAYDPRRRHQLRETFGPRTRNDPGAVRAGENVHALQKKRMLSKDPCRNARCGAGFTCVGDMFDVTAFNCKPTGNQAKWRS